MTVTKSAEAFAAIIAKGGSVFAHPDTIANMPRAHAPVSPWGYGSRLIPNPYLDPGKLYAIAPFPDSSPFPWPKVTWREEPFARFRHFGITMPRYTGHLFTADASGRLSLDARIRIRKRAAKLRRRAQIKADNARRAKQ